MRKLLGYLFQEKLPSIEQRLYWFSWRRRHKTLEQYYHYKRRRARLTGYLQLSYLAQLEMKLVLATILSKYQLALAADKSVKL